MSCVVKRTYDILESPERPDDTRQQRQIHKRCRMMTPPDAAYVAQQQYPHCSPLRQRNVSENFQPKSIAQPADKHIPYGKRRRMKGAANNEVATFGQPKAHEQQRPDLFTAEQVQAIVQKAVAEREAELAEEYDQILLEKLTDQFNLFSKFNEDHIQRQMAGRQECSYIS